MFRIGLDGWATAPRVHGSTGGHPTLAIITPQPPHARPSFRHVRRSAARDLGQRLSPPPFRGKANESQQLTKRRYPP
jgi:hypothetical protein